VTLEELNSLEVGAVVQYTRWTLRKGKEVPEISKWLLVDKGTEDSPKITMVAIYSEHPNRYVNTAVTCSVNMQSEIDKFTLIAP
jgi:hypothetical protein